MECKHEKPLNTCGWMQLPDKLLFLRTDIAMAYFSSDFFDSNMPPVPLEPGVHCVFLEINGFAA